MRDYERLDLQRFRGTFADEPVMAMALAKHGVEACFDGDRAFFRTTLNGTVRLDVLRGRCELDKGGTVWRPSIIHFADGSSDPIYLREGRALDLASRGVPDMAARTIARARARTESARA